MIKKTDKDNVVKMKAAGKKVYSKEEIEAMNAAFDLGWKLYDRLMTAGPRRREFLLSVVGHFCGEGFPELPAPPKKAEMPDSEVVDVEASVDHAKTRKKGRLSNLDVWHIKNLLAKSDMKQWEIGELFGCGRVSITGIASGRRRSKVEYS